MSDRFPLTYTECRARFVHAAEAAGASLERHDIDARGPDGEALSIDVARLGDREAQRVLVVMSGVHGIEGFAGSPMQTHELVRRADDGLPAGCGVLYVHAVNPYGMAWWRRQNESNVDLNRNGVDFASPIAPNEGYRELHPWVCPDVLDEETDRAFLAAAQRFIEERGYAWVKEAITVGQYEIEEGLYFGGRRTEASTRILGEIADRHLAGCERFVVVDLHTGHGAHGDCTLLSSEPTGSATDEMLTALFPDETIERTRDDPPATTPHKHGQLALGLVRRFPAARAVATTLELGTVDDMTMILAERAEHWLHRKGDRASAEGREIAWRHRIASIPDDRAWEAKALAHGERVLSRARRALFEGAGA